ncbi:17497_t:CDS:1, partial [Racocetra fulgida]
MDDYNYYSTNEDPEEDTDQNDYEFMFTHDYLAATKAKSLLEDQVIHDEDNNIEDTLSEHNDNNIDYDKISESNITKLSPCVIVDNLNGPIR